MIEKNPMFWTPKNPAELAARLESFSGSEKAISYMVAMWTTNLCAEMWQPAEPVTVPEDDAAARQACTESTTLFRDLDPAEVAEFRQAARENHQAGDEINPVWHPVYRHECAAIDDEARVIGSID
tara:strand:- start:881 stop:1255 length:375 start_codon:yes stop_codon:yes gene_type:complete